ncbi:MAG: LON peptidase substrate-binding domain-containing protein, partial [Chitinophagales bacterium]|nr:LON peptidase substrate-binding domain-containing protein [Chitinophagales bacterium]
MKDYGFDDKILNPMVEEDVEFLPLLSLEEDDDHIKTEYPKTISLLPLRNTVLFPGVVLPITVGRDKSIKAVADAFKANKLIGVVAQKNSEVEDPEFEHVHTTGTIARIIKQLKMPDGSTTVIIQGKKRFAIRELITSDPYMKANIQVLDDKKLTIENEFLATVSTIKDLANNIIKISPNIPTEATIVLKNIDSPVFLLHFVSSNLQIDVTEKQKILETEDLTLRAQIVLSHLNAELQMLELKNNIQNKVRTDIEKQ